MDRYRVVLTRVEGDPLLHSGRACQYRRYQGGDWQCDEEMDRFGPMQDIAAIIAAIDKAIAKHGLK